LPAGRFNKISDYEKQFESFAHRVKFDDTPDIKHRDKLEQLLLENFASGRPQQPNIWRTILKTRMLRFATAAIITIFILLPLSYGVAKIIKTYFFQEKPVSTTQNGVTVTKMSTTKLSGEYADEKQARRVYDEINQLRKAGKYEKTLIKEWVENGIVFQLYKVRYTLASGEVVTGNEGQAANDTNDADANRPEDEE
jgi:hypothetical protein